MPFLLAFFLVFGLWVGQAGASDGVPSGGPSSVKGDVMYWEGDELIVKEISGREARLRVTPETKIEGTSGRLKTGDKIAAQVASDGHAIAITLQIPDSGVGVPGMR